MAADQADALLDRLRMTSAPIDPIEVAASEQPLLILKSGNYRNRFDEQLEYHRHRNRFILFYNTKHDRLAEGRHHPRTRFSIAHELGHYFLDKHHDYLVRGGSTHGSKSEFFSHVLTEREADAFAAALLMPKRLMGPLVNSGELTLGRIDALAEQFHTSRVSTAIEAVKLSHFPCALVGIRDGFIAWTFLSPSLQEAGCYPRERGSRPHQEALAAWQLMVQGDDDRSLRDGSIASWFRTYDRDDLDDIALAESYLPVPSMNTLLVLLAAGEDDLMRDDDE
jgi:Zn-dependent peptidase ImmA (M78 family)